MAIYTLAMGYFTPRETLKSCSIARGAKWGGWGGRNPPPPPKKKFLEKNV